MIFVGIAMCVVSGIGIIQILTEKHIKTPNEKNNNNTFNEEAYEVYEICDEDDYANKARIRLLKSLKTICLQLNVGLSYHDDLNGRAAGWIKLQLNKIEIMNEYKDEPFVLAHELGHYMAFKKYNDSSELSADREAYKLCSAILTNDEFKYLEDHSRRWLRNLFI